MEQTIRFTGKKNAGHYSGALRRVAYFAPELNRIFIYYTNDFYLKVTEIALLYKNRWQVEFFFK
jgi:IS4 transposase